MVWGRQAVLSVVIALVNVYFGILSYSVVQETAVLATALVNVFSEILEVMIFLETCVYSCFFLVIHAVLEVNQKLVLFVCQKMNFLS